MFSDLEFEDHIHQQHVRYVEATARYRRPTDHAVKTNGVSSMESASKCLELGEAATTAKKLACVNELVGSYYNVAYVFPDDVKPLLDMIEKVMATLPLDDPGVIFRAVQIVADGSRDVFGVVCVERLALTVFENIPCVDVFDPSNCTPGVGRSSTEAIMHSTSDVLLRWLLRTGRMSVEFDRPVLHCLSRMCDYKLRLLLSYSPDVFKQTETKTLRDPVSDHHAFVCSDHIFHIFDARVAVTLKGPVIEIVDKIWGCAESKIPGTLFYTHFAPLRAYANVRRVAQLFVAFRREHAEAIHAVMEMTELSCPLPSRAYPVRPMSEVTMMVMRAREGGV